MAIRVFSVIFWSLFLIESSLSVTISHAAEAKTDVTLRFSKHEGFDRIVFESADESFMKNTSVASVQNQIRVQFPFPFNLKTPNNLGIETSIQGKTLLINLAVPSKIKVLQLSSPPRLSIDIIAPTKEESRKSPAVGGIPAEIISTTMRIVLDPGHGGYDLGIISGELREKDISLSLARSLESALAKKGKTVYLTRKADQFLSITDRALFANQKSPDVFISVHLSASDNFVIYTAIAESSAPDSLNELYGLMYRQMRFTEKSRSLAESLGKALKDEFKKDFIFRKMDLPLLLSVGAAAVMLEVPGTAVFDQAMKSRISDALLKGIAAYANK